MFSRLLNNESWEQFFANARVKCCTVNNKFQIQHDEVDKPSHHTENYMKKGALDDQISPKKCDFSHVLKRLTNSKIERKNADQRLFWQVNNIYLVKRFFTFGLINAEPGWAFTIINGKADIDIYTTDIIYERGILPKDNTFFELEILHPHSQITLTKPFILVAKRICLFYIEYHQLNVNCVEQVQSFEIPANITDISEYIQHFCEQTMMEDNLVILEDCSKMEDNVDIPQLNITDESLVPKECIDLYKKCYSM